MKNFRCQGWALLAPIVGFNPVAWLSFLLLGFGLLIHITLVNIVLGMSVIVPLTEYLSYKRRDADMLLLAKRLFRYLALADLVAGVFGTWVAVELTAFWPKLLYIFATALFFPILIAIVGIVLSIPAIAVYWYGWDRISPRKHLSIGVLMALGALMVPGGFRVLFAFINDPAGFDISSFSRQTATISTNFGSMFANPVYLTLLFHSWFGGLTMSALLAAGVYAWHFTSHIKQVGRAEKILESSSRHATDRGGGSEEKLSDRNEIKRNGKFVKYLLRIGLVFLMIQSAIGVVYYFILSKYSPYMFAAITGNISVAAYDFELVFVPFILLVVVIWITTMILFFQTRKRSKNNLVLPVSRVAAFFLAFSAFAALPLGEASNDASRAPFMLLTGTTGIPANSFTNNEIPITWPIAYVAVIIAVLAIAIFVGTVYFVFVKRREETAAMQQPSRS